MVYKEDRIMSAFTALGRTDLLNIRRDSFMQFLLVYPLLLGLLIRWMLPWVTDALRETFDLTPHHLLIVSWFGLLIMPNIAGAVTGFLLLDERDQDTLTALMVTPLPVRTYAFYRVLTPTLITILGPLVIVPLIGVAVPPPDALVILSIAGSAMGPVYAFFLASFAKNKVEGMAYMKGMGILLLGPAVAWFVPEPWQWLLGVFPTFWPAKAYWLAYQGESYIWVAAVGFVYALGVLAVLFRRFQAQIYR
ncbi:MAG: hypothetical protein D6790_01485 [Caldilineae bacterium]|nr:MAG: hypothetical protein D6790_01485 [Caldilineae bacterium]